MRIALKIFTLCVALVIVGCSTDRATKEAIRRAETIAREMSDSALMLIESVDPQNVRGEDDKAHYRLVEAEVLYYNRILPDREEVAQPLFDHYLTSNDHRERARAMYQYALVMQAEGENAEALYALLEAEKSLELCKYLDKPRLKGLVHRTKGEIYGVECLFSNAYEEHALAKVCFERANLPSHATFATLDMGRVALSLRDYDSAKSCFDEVCRIAEESEDRMLLCETLYLWADLYNEVDEYAECRKVLKRIVSEDFVQFDECHFYSLDAMISASEGRSDDAVKALELASEADDADKGSINYASYVTHRTLGNYRVALRYHEHSKHAQDALMFEVLDKSVLNMQVELLDSRLQSKIREEQLSRERIVWLVVVFTVVVVLLLIYVRYRIRLKNADISRYAAIVEEMQTAVESSNSAMTDTISSMYRDRFAELNGLLDTYYDHSGSSRQKNIIYDQMCDIVEELKHSRRRVAELESAVDHYRNNIMQRLREQIPDLKPREVSIALYSYAGFSNRAISIFIDSDPITVSKLRYGLKRKILNSKAKDAEILAQALSD